MKEQNGSLIVKIIAIFAALLLPFAIIFYVVVGSDRNADKDEPGEEIIAGNPTEMDDSVQLTDLVNSSSYENPDSLNNSGGTNDITKEEMRFAASNSIDVTLTLIENGELTETHSSLITGLRVNLYDESGSYISSEQTNIYEDGLEPGEYTFEFGELDEESEYLFDYEVCDINGEWYPNVDLGGYDPSDPEKAVKYSFSTTRELPHFTGEVVLEEYEEDSNRITIDIIGTSDDLVGLEDDDVIYFEFEKNDEYLAECEGIKGEDLKEWLDSNVALPPIENTGDSDEWLFETIVFTDEHEIVLSGLVPIDGEDTNEYSLSIFTELEDDEYGELINWGDESPLWSYNENYDVERSITMLETYEFFK